MTDGTTITTRLKSGVVREIDEIARREAVDRSTVIRKFIIRSAKEWLIEKSLEEYEAKKITLWQAAKKSKVSVWEIIDEIKKRKIHVPYTTEDLKEDLKVI